MDAIWISAGAIFGVNARYFLGRWIGNRFGSDFPYGTFVINVTGSFLIGVIATLMLERLVIDPRWRLAIIIGFLGGYTTFSSYAYETFALIDRGSWLSAALYVAGTTAFGLVACVAGVLLARSL